MKKRIKKTIQIDLDTIVRKLNDSEVTELLNIIYANHKEVFIEFIKQELKTNKQYIKQFFTQIKIYHSSEYASLIQSDINTKINSQFCAKFSIGQRYETIDKIKEIANNLQLRVDIRPWTGELYFNNGMQIILFFNQLRTIDLRPVKETFINSTNYGF